MVRERRERGEDLLDYRLWRRRDPGALNGIGRAKSWERERERRPLAPLQDTTQARSDSDAVNVGQVSETPDDPEELEGTEESEGEATPEPVQAGDVSGRTGRSWKKVALVTGGGVLTAAGAVVVTLVATHKSAVAQNAAAYANGLLDGYDTYKNQV